MLLAAADFYKIDFPGITAMASGFCSGLARTSGPCGAVTGAVMALGMIQGRQTPSQSIDPCYGSVQRFLDRFKAEQGSLNCTDLLGCDLATKQGQKAYASRFPKGKNMLCQGLTMSAARLLQQVLESTA